MKRSKAITTARVREMVEDDAVDLYLFLSKIIKGEWKEKSINPKTGVRDGEPRIVKLSPSDRVKYGFKLLDKVVPDIKSVEIKTENDKLTQITFENPEPSGSDPLETNIKNNDPSKRLH
jgi:hypothetical protein